MFSTRGRSNQRSRPSRPVAALIGLALTGCGGGYGGGGSTTAPLAPTVTISVLPTPITAGQAVTLTWSTMNASTCVASGAWTGSEAASGTQTITPSAAGTDTFTLSCTAPVGNAYSGGGGGTAASSATLTVNPASSFTATSLVADTAGTSALVTDANLVNPWGIVFAPGAPVWVANNHSETSTLYDGNGHAAALVVALPAATGGATFDPTGIVFNASGTDFVVVSGTKTGAAKFIFTGEGGMIAGWSPTVDATHAIAMFTDAGGAVYKGLAIANNGTANFLYASDFHNNKVDVFDGTFTKQVPSATSFAFVDPTLPAGYAPFGIQAIKNGAGGSTQIYVTYAQPQAPDNHDNVNGAGLGLVDVFDANGVFVQHLVSAGGALNAPWGVALAPADFGTFSNALLVGNFGDGRINGYDASTGTFLGAVSSSGAAFAAPGLWGIAFGNDAANQPHNTLFFAAGLNDEANGVYGRIDLGAAPILNAAPVVALTAPAGNLTGTVALSATAQDSIAVTKIQFFANTNTLIGTATTSPFSVQWDTTTVTNGTVSLTAVATDADGNVGTSPAVMVTVAN